MEKERDFIVYTQRMAGWMMFQGCRLKSVKQSKTDPTKLVYFFPNSDYVLEKAKEYVDKYNKK